MRTEDAVAVTEGVVVTVVTVVGVQSSLPVTMMGSLAARLGWAEVKPSPLHSKSPSGYDLHSRGIVVCTPWELTKSSKMRSDEAIWWTNRWDDEHSDDLSLPVRNPSIPTTLVSGYTPPCQTGRYLATARQPATSGSQLTNKPFNFCPVHRPY